MSDVEDRRQNGIQPYNKRESPSPSLIEAEQKSRGRFRKEVIVQNHVHQGRSQRYGAASRPQGRTGEQGSSAHDPVYKTLHNENPGNATAVEKHVKRRQRSRRLRSTRLRSRLGLKKIAKHNGLYLDPRIVEISKTRGL